MKIIQVNIIVKYGFAFKNLAFKRCYIIKIKLIFELN